ncbi:hypothetical protein J2T07_003381 [Luteibacter jiangsuensis]|uniref:Uncharacterized protein n=1 Tax=Luteibacter jiangsuensis TaxID=637577 RepID=A0ABT9T1L5_9GAMM|nr:hypothetical protein [Luteibacter jiangsuensis]MDQ0011171.1 hypothetical protein [Luteibacter jiangsuensis]
MARKAFPHAPSLDLTDVEVILEQTKVYRNGLQQARIRLDLISKHGGQPSDLSVREIESIRLFDYHNQASGTIPLSDDGSITYKGWSAQRDYRGYVSQTTRSGEPRAIQSYFLYLSANADATETLDVAFEIHGDDLSIWRTNGRCFINGIEQPKPAMDKKVGITVTPVPPERYPASSFMLDRRSLDPARFLDTENADGIFDDIVTVSILLVDQTTLGIRSMTCEPAGLIHWKDKVSNIRQPCFTGYVEPGEVTIHWNGALDGHWGSTAPPEQLVSPEEELGVIVLCGRVDIPSWAGAPEAPVKVTMMDAHGSVQSCHIGFVKGERDELIVT